MVDDGQPDFLGWVPGGEYSSGSHGGGSTPYNPNVPPFNPDRDFDLVAGHFTQPILNLPTDEQNFFNDLNEDQRRAMNNDNMRVPLLNYLSQNEYSADSREFAAALLTVYSRDSELAMDILNLMETDSELAKEMAIAVSEGGQADVLNKVLYDSSFISTKTECIHNRLKNNPMSIYSNMLNNFNNSTNKNLTFKIGNIGTDWGITKGNLLVQNNYTITVNNAIENQGSNLMKFVTLAHELIHAYMFSELESANVLTFDTNGDPILNVSCPNSNTNLNSLNIKDRFEVLICAMNQAGTLTPQWSHNLFDSNVFSVQSYREKLEDLIKTEYDWTHENTGFKNDAMSIFGATWKTEVSKAISWIGLENTAEYTTYINSYSPAKQFYIYNIRNTINNTNSDCP